MAQARGRARAQLEAAWAAAGDPAPGDPAPGDPAHALEHPAAALERAAFNRTVRRCLDRRVVVGCSGVRSASRECQQQYVPASWEDAGFRHEYAVAVRRLVGSLRVPGARAAVEARGDAGAIWLAEEAKPWDLCPEKWTRVVAVLPGAEGVPDGVFRCSRCKTRKTTYTLAQTRSADEPMTTFVSCLNCGRNWKF